MIENTIVSDTENIEKNARDESVCLNCGTVVTGRFCPECGQPSSTPERLGMTTFWKGVAMSFARMTPGFWPTFVGLIIHPWEVIRQYLHGRRVKYSPPVTMVIQLILYTTFFYTFLGHILGHDFFSSSENEPTLFANSWILSQIFSSDVIAKIIMAACIALSCYVVYNGTGGRKFNFSEYLTAAIYMCCCFSIYNSLMKLLYPVFSQDIIYTLIFVLDFIIGSIALFKAFPIKSRWRRCLRWLWFMTFNVLVFIVVIVTIASIHLLLD